MFNSHDEFITFIKENKRESTIRLFYDIETLQYNQKEGRINPSNYKNIVYSVCVGWIDESTVKKVLYPSFIDFFNDIFIACKTKKGYSCKATIILNAHNGNKYDNHFLLHDLLFHFPNAKRENIYLRNALDHEFSKKLKDITKDEKINGIFLEKRVKSLNNLELLFFLNNIKFKTEDNLLKTNMSLNAIGKKMLRYGFISEDELKTSFDYEIFNIDENLTDLQAYDYAYKCYKSLSVEQLKYIENDVILLANCYLHYKTLFLNFDYNKITFSSNVLESYKINPLATYQLLKEVGEGQEKIKIEYSSYTFGDQNFYDYLKSFFKGGLNFYNEKYLNKTVSNLFSIDLNSSYPHSMYKNKVPTFLKDYDIQKEPFEVDFLPNPPNDDYYIYRVTFDDFNQLLLSIESKIIRKMLVKYYTGSNTVNINTYTLKILNLFMDKDQIPKKIKVLSYVSFECCYFGGREIIKDNYFIKTQGKMKNKIIMKDPYNIIVTDEENTELLTQAEIDNSKVLLNGIFGIPSLRSHFNLFKLDESQNYHNVLNGYKNTERNIVFSLFVTSVSFYNLIAPLQYLEPSEIDDHFIYCDTDSLYLRKEVKEKIPLDYFDELKLGSWKVEHDNILNFFVLNHKKYAFEVFEKGKNENIIKCGGIPLDSFDLSVPFSDFIKNQFHNNAIIDNKKSIYNKQKTISIYPSKTYISVGNSYPDFFSTYLYQQREKLIERIREELTENGEEADGLYIESDLGVISMREVFEYKNQTTNNNLSLLKFREKRIKSLLS